MKKSITKTKERESNMELLRIVAMILVMIVHADFRALGWPSILEIGQEDMFPRFLVESFSIICVNTFVLLSGWYGIRFKWNRLGELLFQVMFFQIIAFFLFLLIPICHQSPWGIIKHFLLFNDTDYWFVKCYILLYVFSPILNSFIESCSKKEFFTVLFCFFMIQFYMDSITNGVQWFNHGYSGLSFIGLYLLARYIRIYQNPLIGHSKSFYLIVYIGLAIINGGGAFIIFSMGYVDIYKKFFDYSNPIIIIQALVFLLFFTKLQLKSPIINNVALSSFSIYLLHSSFSGYIVYDTTLRYIYNRGVWIVLYFTFFISLVFIISILLDKLRLSLWTLFINIKK